MNHPGKRRSNELILNAIDFFINFFHGQLKLKTSSKHFVFFPQKYCARECAFNLYTFVFDFTRLFHKCSEQLTFLIHDIHTYEKQAVRSVYFSKHFVFVTWRLDLICSIDNHFTFQKSHTIGSAAYV